MAGLSEKDVTTTTKGKKNMMSPKFGESYGRGDGEGENAGAVDTNVNNGKNEGMKKVLANSPKPGQHPLQHEWVFWFDQPRKKKIGGALTRQEWNASLEQVYSFQSVEDFWCLFNNLLPVSMIANGAKYSLFKKGIRPEWEDKQNDKGGRWHMSLRDPDDRARSDEIWLYLVLGLIGDLIDEGEAICGATISPRPKDLRMSLWTKHCHNKNLQMKIGRNLRKALMLPDRLELSYRSHETDEGGRRGNMYQCGK